MSDQEKQIEVENNADHSAVDSFLRPGTWEEYIGQETIKKNLRIIIQAAQMRSESIDHLLFYGQAGLGKTTLAGLVAKEFGASLRIASGPTIDKAGDLAAILSNLEDGDILFIDEIHRLNRMIEEVLYPAMESRKLHIILGKGAGARSISLDLPPFTLIGATTRVNLLSAPLRSRFGATFRLDYYNENDIASIVKRSAEILGVSMTSDAIDVIAKASRFTPRVANRLLKRARDYMDVAGKDVIDGEVAQKTLEMLEIDEIGLEAHDRALLRAIIDKFNGGPVGLGTLSATINEDKSAIEEVYEPFLMRVGLLKRTPSGRMVEEKAFSHLRIRKDDTGTLL
jgi:Holliday junction DNA helicase RuvB